MIRQESSLALPEIKKRVIASFMSLTARQVAMRAISFISLNLVLAKVLPVETLGIFNIATAIVTFFAFFSDIGLAASLVQKKEPVTDDDIKTVFTIQQSLVTLLSLTIILGAPWIGQFYGLDDSGVWLVRVLGFAFFLSSLKVVPAVLLERQLKFQPLVAVEVAETVVFNGLLILLVFANQGIWSFSVAALTRGLLGTILIYLLAPVPVGFRLEKEAAKKLLSFGIPFQANSLLALLKDRLVPLVIARMVGTTGVGFITWSQGVAFLPLEIMNIVIRITFPAFSRLQGNTETLTKALEKSLFLTALLVYPVLFGLGAILPALVTYVVSDKWQPAIPSFYFFATSAYWAVISTTFTNALNAIGQIKVTLRLMVLWTVLTWVLTPLLVSLYGFNGVALTSFIISFTSILTVIFLKKFLAVRVINSVLLPTLASALMGLTVYLFSQNFVYNWIGIIEAIVLGALVYSAVIFLLGREIVLRDFKSLRNA